MFGDKDCEAEASSEDLRQLLDAHSFEKYERFSKLKQDENYRDCPSCGNLILGSRRRPQMACEKCSATFCFFHSNAHPNISCWQYARNVRAEQLASTTTINSISKKCPSCKSPVEKSGGE
jgi:hypothetical protein